MTMVMVTLRAEAGSEAIRLADARSRARDDDDDSLAQLEADGPWIMIARRTPLRRRLGRRVLLVWRVAYEDACGRTVESRLAAIAIQLRASPPKPITRGWIDGVLRAVDAEVRALIEAEVRGWRDAAAATVQSFTVTRLTRERAIAASTRATGLDAFQPGLLDRFQPGLFDRRAERLRQVHAGAVADGDRDATARLAALERSAAVVQQPARLLLVVVPSC
jgi:hypothetical protein